MSHVEMTRIGDEEEAYHPPRAPKYESYMACEGFGICLMSVGFWPCNLIMNRQIADSAQSYLTESAVVNNRGYLDVCCHMAHRTTTIPLEQITDVALSTGCWLECYDLKSLEIQTAGNTFGAEATIYYIADPDEYRNKILDARNERKQVLAGGGSKSSAMPKDPIGKLREVKALYEMGVLTQSEHDSIRVQIFSSAEFSVAKEKLLAAFME